MVNTAPVPRTALPLGFQYEALSFGVSRYVVDPITTVYVVPDVRFTCGLVYGSVSVGLVCDMAIVFPPDEAVARTTLPIVYVGVAPPLEVIVEVVSCIVAYRVVVPVESDTGLVTVNGPTGSHTCHWPLAFTDAYVVAPELVWLVSVPLGSSQALLNGAKLVTTLGELSSTLTVWPADITR